MKHNVENGHRAGGRPPLGYALQHIPTIDNEKRIAALIPRLELSDAPLLSTRLKELEADRVRVADALRDSAQNAQVKEWLENITPAEAKKVLRIERDDGGTVEQWIERDGASVEERRAALAAIVDKVLFDPTTGTGHMLYRIGWAGARFDASGVLLASPRGTAPIPALRIARVLSR